MHKEEQSNTNETKESMNVIIDHEAELVRKADLVLSELSTHGGLLSPEQTNRFLKKLIEAPTILGVARTVPMGADTMKLNKIGIGTRVLRAGVENTALTEAQRTTPVTSQVVLETKEVIAEMRLPYTVLEDNIEGQDLVTTVLDLLAEQAAADLEDLILNGDEAFVDGDDADNQAYMRLFDGVLKRVTSHVVNANSAALGLATFNTAFKAMPVKFRQNRAALRWFLTPNDEANYMQVLANRDTALGDAYVTGAATLRIMGIEATAANYLPASRALLTNPKNIIIGIRRRLTLESEKLISTRQLKFVLTARVAHNLEEEDAIVEVTNIGVPA